MTKRVFKDIGLSLKRAILLLRFRSPTPSRDSPVFATYHEIQMLVRVHSSKIRRLCIEAVQRQRPQFARQRQQTEPLHPQHIEYLISRETLTKQKHLSLKARLVMFHRRFPERKISSSTLRRLYLKNGIKYKYAKKRYQITEQKQSMIHNVRVERFTDLLDCQRQKQKIIFVDETIFQAHSQQYRCWARKYDNIELPQSGLKIKSIAAIVFISIERGLEYFWLKSRSVNKEDFRNAIQDVYEMNKATPAIIFMDNLRLHQSKTVQSTIKNQGWRCIFNAPYSSEYHCIEEVFSLAKRNYRGLLMQKNFQLNNKEHEKVVEKSILDINPEHIRKIILRHFELMRSYVSYKFDKFTHN